MPTNTPLVLNKTNLQLTLDTYEGNGYVDYAVHGGLDASNDGQLEEFWLNTGITAVKVFTCYSSPDMGWVRAVSYTHLPCSHALSQSKNCNPVANFLNLLKLMGDK